MKLKPGLRSPFTPSSNKTDRAYSAANGAHTSQLGACKNVKMHSDNGINLDTRQHIQVPDTAKVPNTAIVVVCSNHFILHHFQDN